MFDRVSREFHKGEGWSETGTQDLEVIVRKRKVSEDARDDKFIEYKRCSPTDLKKETDSAKKCGQN